MVAVGLTVCLLPVAMEMINETINLLYFGPRLHHYLLYHRGNGKVHVENKMSIVACGTNGLLQYRVTWAVQDGVIRTTTLTTYTCIHVYLC